MSTATGWGRPTGGALSGIRVLDLSRVLAGPWCGQILGDLGADVIKIENVGTGDDTRHWGPPFLDDGSGDAAYFTAANRNKRSVAIDLDDAEARALVCRLAAQTDIVIENFKVGALAKRRLDYASVAAANPGVIYCSITGFGQSGPYAARGGYDFLVQGMSGLMSVTGHPEGTPGAGPMKVGVAVSDLFAGLYAAISILAALNHRAASGSGQHIDLALFDAQVAALVNQTANYLVGGEIPRALGNQHPNVVPYQDFATSDGYILIASGNDRQFAALCSVLGCEELARDPCFAASGGRSVNRAALLERLVPLILDRSAGELSLALERAGVPAGPINRIDQALADPQIAARGLVREIARSDGTTVPFVAFPGKLDATPASYRLAPPTLGADTVQVLRDVLGCDAAAIDGLVQRGAAGVSDADLVRS